MIKRIIKKIVTLRNFLVYKKFDFLSKIRSSSLRINPEAEFVVSIASYPKRAHLLPAVYEALNQQTELPKKWILVLSIEEWPEKRLPFYLEKMIKRGLEIIWVKNNTYAVKKLVPVIEKYPELGVITLDDDIIYNSYLVSNLINHKHAKTGNIVGHVGKALFRKNTQLNMFFREKRPANINTNPNQVFLIGLGGIFYPPKSLSSKVTNSIAINEIVPGRGSDIWFWAAAISNNTKQYCIPSFQNKKIGIPINKNNATQPRDMPGQLILEQRFQNTIDYFEIREKLLLTLPNHS